MRWAALLLALAAAGCADRPQLVMINPRTGAAVDCQVSRACLSACQAHGFRAVPGIQADRGGGGVPSECTN